MSRTALRAFAIWLLAMLAGAAIVYHSRFAADMSFFLPAKPTAEQQVLVDQIKEGVVSRLLMVGIGGGDSGQRARVSRALRQQLASDRQFVSVQNGETASLAAERDVLLTYRYLLSPAVEPARFTVDGLRTAIADSVDRLTSPAAMLLKPYLTSDPTGELYALLSRFDTGTQPENRDGVWASRDGERAMLLIQTRALGSDTDGQLAAIQTIERAFADAARSENVTGLSLQLSGPGRFAVEARATIQADVTRLSLISTLAIVAVLFAVYRSLRLMTLGLLPVLSGALAGIVAVSLVHGTVFGITVGFGSALIGEAVDYSIYYFVQSGRLGTAGWRERFWPTIRLGVLTSIFGFGALLFSGFPGLSQLGLYSLAGVFTAALVTRYLLPALAGDSHRLPDLSAFGLRLQQRIAQLAALRLPALLLSVAALGYLASERGELWHPNISLLSTVTAAEAEVDARLRADLAAPDSRYLVVVHGQDREAALQAAEEAGAALDTLVAAGVIGGYDSPARFLPSTATQTIRQASLPDADTLRTRLAEAQTNSPLATGKLTPFIDAVQAAKNGPLLTRSSLDGSALALVVDSLLIERPQGWSVLLPLRPAGAGDALEIPTAQVRQALAGREALFIDMKGEFDTLYASYMNEAIQLSLAGLLAIVLLLGATLRSLRRLAEVMLPLVAAVLIVIAGLHALGQALHLLHLVGMLLIVAVGSNYALFFDRLAHADQPEPATLASMAVANLTTAIGFGTLALSKVPVLNAIGVTVGPGAILALLLSAIFMHRQAWQ